MHHLLRTGAATAAAFVLLALGAPGRATADTVLLKDGRTVECPKAEKQTDGSWILKYQNGDVRLPASLVKDAFTMGAQGYEPKNDEEKANLEKGLVPYEGKWIPKAERDAKVAKKSAEAKKRIDEAKAHREWRNRYRAKTTNFEFEYTIPPEIAKNYMDMMETYFANFTRDYHVQKPKERLKVCLYHDYDTFLEVAGAEYGVLAYYRYVQPRELNFFYDRLRPEETLAVMFHETQHYLCHCMNFHFDMPHNLGEAFAEYYGGSTWDPVKKVMTTGGVQEGRLTEVQTDIQGGERRKLEKYLHGDLGYDDYTWGWSFVHFMMETPKYSKKFRAFYIALTDFKEKDVLRIDSQGDSKTVDGAGLVRAFKKYVGVDDLDALEKEWYEYIDTKLKLTTVVGYEEAAFAAANTGRRIRAKRLFKEAVDKGSKNPVLYLRYGDMLELEDKGAAEAMYRKGLELDPLNTSLYVALGNLLRLRKGEGEEEAGKKLIHLAEEIDPDSADTSLLVEEALAKTALPSAPAGGGGGKDPGGN